jgi:hypothetical protein
MHLTGETIKDAAKLSHTSEKAIRRLKERLFTDQGLFRVLEGVFQQCAMEASLIFMQKKDELSAKEAAVSAGIFTDNALNLSRARAKGYREEDKQEVHILVELQKTLNAVEISRKKKEPEIVDAEILTLEDKENEKS